MNHAYNELKHRLTSSPVFLNFPDDVSPMVLSIDASGEGMGGVLRQLTPDGPKVIKYVSKKFNSAQKKYSTTERECLAMVWCLQKLKEYVWGRPIEIETDHCPLCSFNKKKFHNSRIDRWQLGLSEYHLLKITYKRGRCNCDADLLSRFPYDKADVDDDAHLLRVRSYNQSAIDSIDSVHLNVITRSMKRKMQRGCDSSVSNSPVLSPTSSETTRNDSKDVIDGSMEDFSMQNTPITDDCSTIIDFSMERIRAEQMKDPEICRRIQLINDNLHRFPNETIAQQVLFKSITRPGNIKLTLPWLPTSMISEVLTAYHDHPLSGHFGVKRTFTKIKDKFFWRQMYDTVRQYLRSCAECARFNVQRQKKPGLLQQEQPPEGVFEVMQMDFWKAPVQSTDGNQYVLIITDRLSKYVFARALPSATAKDVAETLFEDVVLKHGAIRCLQSDQGSHFRNELLAAITKLTGCKQIFSIPYHPMSNGQVERFNSTFCDQLKKYSHENVNDWDKYLQSIVWAYNSGIHAATNFTPYELAFNRHLVSPFETSSSTVVMLKPHDYWEVANRFKTLALRTARMNIQRNHLLSKQRYDHGRKHPIFNTGDLVWVRVLTHRSKFDSRFHGPFIILQRINDVKYIIKHIELDYQQEEHVNNFIPFYERT